MLRLFFFPIELAFRLALLPIQLMVSFFRSGLALGLALVFGVVSLLAGLVRGILPLLLIGIGLMMIANAYKAAKAKKEGESFAEGVDFERVFSKERVG